MTFITGEKHQESREWGWVYQSLLCEHLMGSSVQSSEPRKGLAKRRGTLCPCYLGDRSHKHKHRHTNTCTKTLTFRNTTTDAQSKTCMLVRTYELSDRTPGDLSDLHFHSSYTADLAKLSCQHLTEFTTAAFLDILDDPNSMLVLPYSILCQLSWLLSIYPSTPGEC